jgi:ribose/xylose/arabinose/galactoside ABC-type transport system permease subunit
MKETLQRGGWRARLAQGLTQFLGPILGLIFLVALFASLSSFFLTDSNMSNILRQTAFTMILALGQTVVILSAGIDLSIAANAALAGCAAALAMTSWGLEWWQGWLLALGVGVLGGLLNGLIIVGLRVPDFIATLGTMLIFRGVALLITGGLPVPSHLGARELTGYLPEQMLWFGYATVLGLPVLGLVGLFLALLTALVLRYTAFGRSVYAVGGNPDAARISGISVARTKVLTYAFAGLMAGIAGYLLTARLNSANALMAEGEELRSIASVVIGGTNLFGGQGGVLGTVVGALIIGVLGNGLNLLNVNPFWQRIITGLLLIFVVALDQLRRNRR